MQWLMITVDQVIEVRSYACLNTEEETDGGAHFDFIEYVMLNQLKLKVGQMLKIFKHQQSLANVVRFILTLWQFT